MQYMWSSVLFPLTRLLLFVILLAMIPPAYCNSYADHDKVIVSISVPWEPYSYFDRSGELIGSDIDLLKQTMSHMNQTIAYVPNIPLKRLASSKGKLGFNTVLAATYNDDRAKENYFSKPYRTEKIGVYFTNKTFQKYDSVEQLLENKLIGSLNASAYYGAEFERVKTKYASQLYHSESVRRRVKKLIGNRIDFIINDVGTMEYTMSTMGLRDIYQSDFLVIESEVSFMFLKSEFSPRFINEFNQSLTQVLTESKD